MVIQARDVIGIQAALLAAACLLVAARLFLRRHNTHKHLFVSDLMLCLSALDLTAMTVLHIILFEDGSMVDYSGLKLEATKKASKLMFLAWVLYDAGLYLSKFSILAFYYHIVHPAWTRLRICLCVLTFVVVVSGVSSLVLDLFWCRDHVSHMPSMDPVKCNRSHAKTIIQINWALNMGTDILIMIFPFPLLRSVRIRSRHETIALVSTFTLGLLTMGVSIARVIAILTGANLMLLYIWCPAELSTAIIVVALPALRPLLRRIPFLSSKTGSICQGEHRVLPSRDMDSAFPPGSWERKMGREWWSYSVDPEANYVPPNGEFRIGEFDWEPTPPPRCWRLSRQSRVSKASRISRIEGDLRGSRWF